MQLKTGFLLETKDRGDSVFLGASDDEASDDVNDAHPAQGAPFLSSIRRWLMSLSSSVSGGV